MDERTAFGPWLKQRRKAINLTQASLAQRAGCDVTTLRKLEAGTSHPSAQLAAQLAAHLQLTADEQSAFVALARTAPPDDRAPVAGAQAAPAPATSPRHLPGGTVTLLFTDIEGSTRLLNQLGAQYDALLAEYRALLRTACTTHGGHAVDTAGDGLFVAFPRAPDALAAAVAAQRALAAHAWPDGVTMATRMGLHSGAPRQSAEGYVGLDVHRAARIGAAGHGGQVLLSAATQELVADDLPAGVALRDLGRHQLKDLPRAEHIFQLLMSDLPADFPPLRTAGRQCTNLPVPATPLIGRAHEITTVAAQLRQGAVRLLTLTGPGGMGKTRLALAVAAELRDAFEDGVWFVDLAPIGDPALVAPTIAQRLDIPQVSEQPPLESLASYLRERRLLLVLDNFEQLLAAAPLVGELLARAPDLQVLVTSRAPLHLSGEHEVAVAPLALPAGQVSNAEELAAFDAVALFVQRAQAAKHDFQLSDETVPAVAEICRRLDGLPLAIELAAARSKLLPPPALLARLSSRLATLTSGARDAPARQQTLRATVEWSYHLLDAAGQRLLARLGVFVGGWTLAAAAALCDDDPEQAEPPPESLVPDVPQPELLDDLSALVDQSLLQVESGTDGEPRFRMLETIREYAVERLDATGVAHETRRRHAAYFLALAEAVDFWATGGERDPLQRLDVEQGNLRAALAWCRRAGDPELTTARLVHALAGFWLSRYQYVEARPWLEELLRELGPAGVADAPRTLYWAHMLLVMAFMGLSAPATSVSETPAAAGVGPRRLMRESIAIFRAVGDRRELAKGLFSSGNFEVGDGDFAAGRAHLEESIALARELGDTVTLDRALGFLGRAAVDYGDLAQAAALYHEGLALARQAGDEFLIAFHLEGLADVALDSGRPAEAEIGYADARRRYQAVGDPLGPLVCLFGLAAAEVAQGQTVQAGDHLVACLIQFRDLDPSLMWIPDALARLAGLAAVAEVQPEGARRAARLLGAVEALREAAAFHVPPRLQATYDRDMAVARAQLDDDAFAAAWVEGRAMSLEQAIDYALQDAS